MLEAPQECCDSVLSIQIVRGRGHEHANPPHPLRLLRPCRDRPRRGRAAEPRDELAPPHSITSSAPASRVAGTPRPSALAGLRLTISSNLVGCRTGNDAGLAPPGLGRDSTR